MEILKIDHILGHSSNIYNITNIKIVQSIFSDHNVIKVEINYRNKMGKNFQHVEAEQNTAKQQMD